MNEALEVYTKAFQTLKGNRTLEWNSGLGTVHLTVELGRFQCSGAVSGVPDPEREPNPVMELWPGNSSFRRVELGRFHCSGAVSGVPDPEREPNP